LHNFIKKEILDIQSKLPINYKLNIEDGTFFPLSYYTIRKDGQLEEKNLIKYQKSTKKFNKILTKLKTQLKKNFDIKTSIRKQFSNAS